MLELNLHQYHRQQIDQSIIFTMYVRSFWPHFKEHFNIQTCELQMLLEPLYLKHVGKVFNFSNENILNGTWEVYHIKMSQRYELD